MSSHDAIADAVYQLQRHGGILRVGERESVDGTTQIAVDVQVPLPSRSRRAGISATGVRASETCLLVFGRGWPLSAPRVYLREDFPLDLPHINPHRAGEPVSPCIFEGSLDELLHRFGLDAIVDQLIDWLRKAAAGNLVDLEHGWEPTRRDSCPSTVVFSAERVAAEGPPDGSILAVNAGYVTLSGGLYAILDDHLVPQAEPVFSQAIHDDHLGKWGSGRTAAFIIRAPLVGGEPQVFGRYQPETVCDLPTMLARATELGIDRESLGKSLDAYYQRSIFGIEQNPQTWTHGIFAIVILAVERPASLVGSPGRSLEFLPYIVTYEIDPKVPLNRTSTVHPAFHAHALSPALLARTSGIAPEPTAQPIAVIGCGSLGSKIALHLARAGFGNLTLVDNEPLSPHNMARHALMEKVSVMSQPRKTERMKAALASLSHEQTRAFDADATEIFTQTEQFDEIIPEDATVIVETTASLKVLAAETQSTSLDKAKGRLARVAMYGQGRCISVLLEGMKRAGRVDDLEAFLFDRCRIDPSLRTAIAGDTSEPTTLFVGENCRSLTAPISDSKISRAASSAALQLERWLIDGLPNSAMLCIGTPDASGLGLAWTQISLGPTTELNVANDGVWHVRVLHPIAQSIDEDARNWAPCETGGALIGHIAYESRTIIVAGLVEAPPDSIREPARFTLGTQGLIQSLRSAHQASLGHLGFIGTWHSHPKGGPHSGIDHQTLRKIAEDAGGRPAISLVWTPWALSCVVDRW